MVKYEQITETRGDAHLIEESFEFGEKMLNKHVDMSEVMGMSADDFTDMQQMYDLANSFKEQMIRSIKQQNLQTEMLYDLTDLVMDLKNEISILQEEIDSLKSKAEKDD